VQFDSKIDEASQMLLFDAQTSGGLLLAIPPNKLDGILARSREVEQELWVVGEAFEGDHIEVF
jgi:selenide,water dikinase